MLEELLSPQAPYHIRQRILEVSNKSRSAHLGSSLSCVEILYFLLFSRQHQQYPIEKVILSKGHAAMALYATAEYVGLLESKHLDQYMTDNSYLWGHPSKSEDFPFIDWSTGALGHGLPATVGMAYSSKYLTKKTDSVFTCVISDGECNEGSNWEAALFAAHHQLSNLVTIIDYNKIQSFGFCNEVMGLEPFAQKWEAFGWKTVSINGHSVKEIDTEFKSHDFSAGAPLCIIANTVKAKGLPSLENTVESHYRPATEENILEFLKDHEK